MTKARSGMQCLAGLLVAAGTVVSAQAATPEMEALANAAKQEGQVEVILAGQISGKLRSVMPEFEKKYGVTVNFQTGSGSDHAKRILAERQLGRYTVDAWIGGANTGLLQLIPNKAIARIDEALKDPDVTDQSKWYQGKHHYSDPESKYIFTWGATPLSPVAYNTTMVKPEEITSYADLLNPKWKGKIVAMSPAERGVLATTIPILMNPKMGEAWFRRWLTEMDVTFVSDARQGAEWIALGRYPIGLFGLQSAAKDMQTQGFPITDHLPHPMAEGDVLVSLSNTVMLFDKAPNPNAAVLFINWALSREGQTHFFSAADRSDTLRIDVPSETLVDPQYRINRDADYFIPFESRDYIDNQEKYTAALRKIVTDAGLK